MSTLHGEPTTDKVSATTFAAARRGALVSLPLLAGYVPFALVIGSIAAEHGGPFEGWAGGWLIFGGSAHLAAMRTLDSAGAVAAILTGLLINTRLVVYSSSLARRWSKQPTWFRVAAAGLIIDPTWAVAEPHAARLLPRRRPYPRHRLDHRDRHRRADRRPARLGRPLDRHPVVPRRTRRRRLAYRGQPHGDRRGRRGGLADRALAERNGAARRGARGNRHRNRV